MLTTKGSFFLVLSFFITLLFLTASPAQAAPIDKFPITVTQPDGMVLHLFVSGDEFYNWLYDAEGYTIVQHPDTGYYVYADEVNGKLVPTGSVVGRSDPAAAGLKSYLNISAEQRDMFQQGAFAQTREMRASAPRTGTIQNLVIFIRFAGESEFGEPTSTYTSMMNSSTAGADSLRNYYREVSYNALTINSTLLPTPGSNIVSYQDSHPRGYYQPYNTVTNPIGYNSNEWGQREQTLLRDAINYVNSLGQFPSGASLDSNGDGYVDMLTFIVKGGPDAGLAGLGVLLWPHASSLYGYTVTINGKIVDGYGFHLQTLTGTGVLAHELFHVLGAPDLYHYVPNGMYPVSDWDLMAGTGPYPPQHMGCYMKFKYGGWISSIPEITTTGTYALNPLTSSTNNCKKIASPNSTTEFFVLEYRSQTSSIFEGTISNSGLLVYRINTLVSGNAGGPPDEVYIYRPGGTPSEDGEVYNANFSSNVGRTSINDSTDPSSFLSNGAAGGLNISNIGAAHTTISFTVSVPAFSDVPFSYWAYDFIERLYDAGITGGCGVNPLIYCPESTVTRAQMAVFLLRGIHGSSHSPPAVGGSTGFGDVPVNYWSAAWIKQLAAEGITGGCGSGNYCPEYPVTRDQMAVFLLRSKYGASYSPPAVGASTGFGDVPVGHWAAPWIKQLVTEGITAGCGSGNYCPSIPVSRAQMAVFLVRTFNLP